jgi:hypothetical protein
MNGIENARRQIGINKVAQVLTVLFSRTELLAKSWNALLNLNTLKVSLSLSSTKSGTQHAHKQTISEDAAWQRS